MWAELGLDAEVLGLRTSISAAMPDLGKPRRGRPGRPDNRGMCGALLLGLFCGAIARALIPGDAFRGMSGPKSWLVSIGLGLLGAVVGWLIFTVGFGIGDNDIFDWGGVLSALIGTLIVVPFATVVLRVIRRPGH